VADLHDHLEGPATWDAHRRGLFVGTTREILTRASKILQPKGREAQRRLRDQLWERLTALVGGISETEWIGAAHGDLHLGQVLVRDEQMVFLDFDGGSIDAETPLPRVWDLACLSWSAWRLSCKIAAPDDPARRNWLGQILRLLSTSPGAQGGAMMETCLMRRWAEEICAGAGADSAAADFLTGRNGWSEVSYLPISNKHRSAVTRESGPDKVNPKGS
jgi:hypothetical protein